ncbi:MAG: dockerin type I domain-containing protein [Planctomycetota bacterium]
MKSPLSWAIALIVFLTARPMASADDFIRGDCNVDGNSDISDAVFLLSYLFLDGSVGPSCFDACDLNDDGQIDLSDALYQLYSLKVPGSPQPPPPSGSMGCGSDPTSDSLDCVGFSPCP